VWLALAAAVVIVALAGLWAWTAKRKGFGDAIAKDRKEHKKIDDALALPIPLRDDLRARMRARLRRLRSRLPDLDR